MKDLLTIRKERNLTQKNLADVIKVSQKQISRIEAGECELSLTQYAMMVQALQLTNLEAKKLMDEAIAIPKPPRKRRKTKTQD